MQRVQLIQLSVGDSRTEDIALVTDAIEFSDKHV
jgi:hypothetical protein